MTTKKKKETIHIPEKIQSLIDIGIPLKMVVFHKTILSFGAHPTQGTPEYALYSEQAEGVAPKTSRRAKLWLTPTMLVVQQGNTFKVLPNTVLADTVVL